MKNRILAILVLIPLIAFSNEDSGVKETNYQIGLNYSENKVDNLENSNNTALSASVNLPVYKYIGSSIGVNGYKTGKVRQVKSNLSSETSAYNVSGAIFLRDKDIGKLGVIAGYGKIKTNIDFDSNSNDYHTYLKSNFYSMYGDYYLNDFTFSANRYVTDLDNGYKINTWNIGASYYINENTIISTNQTGMDSKSNYNIGISHQPYFLNDSTEVGISYQNHRDSSSVSFSVSYYFGTSVSLKVRNREYR